MAYNRGMTTRDDLQTLLLVQAVDTRLDRARAALAALDTGATVAAEYNAGKAEFNALRTVAVKAQADQRDAELALQSIETQTMTVNQMLYGKTPRPARELSDLQKKLEMLGRQKDEAEGKVLEAMETAANALAAGQSKETGLTALAEKHRALRAAYKERSAALTKEIAAIQTERDQTAKPLTTSVLARYEAIRAKKSGIGVSPLSPGPSCGACHTQLSSLLVDEVRAAQHLQQCEHCGRLLAPEPGKTE